MLAIRTLLISTCALWVTGCATGARPPETVAPDVGPRLALDTAEGRIVIELDLAAAPRAVTEVVRRASDERYYDGLAFAHARPGIELGTDPRSAEDGVRLEHEVDFVALGLDRVRVASVGEAMDLLQFELLPAESETRSSRQPARTERLGEWAETFRRTGGAEFLVGVSRAEVLEALGYRASHGLASRPPVAGAVFLRPAGPSGSGLGLTILLVDRPELTGSRVVIGRVVEGLAVADAISRRPMRHQSAEDSRPADPVTIERALVRRPDRARTGASGGSVGGAPSGEEGVSE